MRIVVRADSSKTMGFGHITRSLTLARALQDAGADVIAVGEGMTQGSAISPSFGGLNVIEKPAAQKSSEIDQLLDLHPDGVVTDGYHFSKSFFEQLDEASIPYAVIDDNGETSAINPLVVHNQNPHANRELYGSFANEPKFLLGLDYALLRPEVFALITKPPKKNGRIVVTLGGTDSANLTVPIITALVEAGHNVAVNERFREQLIVLTSKTGDSRKIEFFPSGMFLESLASADLAVLGAGTSLWEANALGTPAIGVIVTHNQVQPALRGVSDGYIFATANGITAPTKTFLVSEVIELATQLQDKPLRKTPKRVKSDSAAAVARALLVELSNHLEKFR